MLRDLSERASQPQKFQSDQAASKELVLPHQTGGTKPVPLRTKAAVVHAGPLPVSAFMKLS